MVRSGVTLLILSLGLVVGGCHDAGAADPAPPQSSGLGLRPGGSITLSAPSSAEAQLAQETSEPETGTESETPEGFRSDEVGERIGARARALSPFQQHGGTVYRSWDIEISDESDAWQIRNRRFDTVLQAQISGSFNLRGFLFVVGYGKASVSVDLSLLDLGTESDPIAPKPIYGTNLASHEVDPNVALTGALELAAHAGAPYVGVSGGYSVGFDTPIAVELVRDEVNFGFQSLLQRGHTYRVRIDLTVDAKQAGAPGFPSMSFFMAGRADPDNDLAQVDPTTESLNAELGDPLDPDFWMGGINELMEARFPVLAGRGLRAFEDTPRFFFPEITVDLFGERTTWGDKNVNLSNFPDQFLPSLPDTNAALAATSDIEIPRSLDQLVRDRLATRQEHAALKSRGLTIDRPGLEFPDGITVTLATDTVEEVALMMATDD